MFALFCIQSTSQSCITSNTQSASNSCITRRSNNVKLVSVNIKVTSYISYTTNACITSCGLELNLRSSRTIIQLQSLGCTLQNDVVIKTGSAVSTECTINISRPPILTAPVIPTPPATTKSPVVLEDDAVPVVNLRLPAIIPEAVPEKTSEEFVAA